MYGSEEIKKVSNIREERSDQGGLLDVWSFLVLLEDKDSGKGRQILFAITYEALNYSPTNKTYGGDVRIWQEQTVEKLISGKVTPNQDYPLYIETTEGFAQMQLEQLFAKRYFPDKVKKEEI